MTANPHREESRWGKWATITAATMKLTMVSGTSLAYNASAYQVTGGEWDPTTIQWTNKPAANILLESNISNNDRTKYQFSVLTAVQHWYDRSFAGGGNDEPGTAEATVENRLSRRWLLHCPAFVQYEYGPPIDQWRSGYDDCWIFQCPLQS